MNFLADESCVGALVRGLRADGHLVDYVAELLRGSDDARVLATAEKASQVLITEDLDFGELVFRQGFPALGVILIRLENASPEEKLRRLREFLLRHADRIEGSFVVISANRERIRILPSPNKPSNQAGID